MYTLILDSSNIDLSVGIASKEEVIDFISYEAWQCQSEYMIQEIDKLLTKHHLTKDDLEGVIVTIGPGSYTGIRIALTIAKVTCLALSIPLYAISSLQALKCENKPSICLMNARSKRSYIGVYEGDKCLLKDQVMTNEEVLSYIESHQDYVLCGDISYLGKEGYKSNVIKEMFSLKNDDNKYDDALIIKPVYLKD